MNVNRRLIGAVIAVLALIPFAALAGTSRVSNSKPAVAYSQPSSDVAVPGRIIAKLRPNGALARRSLADNGASLQQRWGRSVQPLRIYGTDSYVLDVSASSGDVEALARVVGADAEVEYIQPDYIYHLPKRVQTQRSKVVPNDEGYQLQYSIPRIQGEEAWDITTGSPNTLVAVIDTGVYGGHPDFGSNVIQGRDFVNNDDDSSDDQGHGTHTAGIVAAVGNNGRGIAGWCWSCKILAIKVLDNEGSGRTSWGAAGIRFAADRGAKIINLSLGGLRDDPTQREAVTYANGKGSLLIVAAGNEAEEGNPVEYPAAYPESLAVGATDIEDVRAPFSNFGSYVDISAPGVEIVSLTYAAGQTEAYDIFSGTSEATPAVAGVAALMLSINPNLTNNNLRDLLTSTSDDRGSPGRDDQYGSGRVNALKAVRAAQAFQAPAPTAAPPPPPNPTSPPPSGPTTIPVPTPVPNPTTEPLPTLPPTGVDGAPVFFPETGYALGGDFLNFWETHGGLPVFGFPIRSERKVDGRVSQWLERNRFELHAQNKAPYNVLLGRLGVEALAQQGRAWESLPKGNASAPHYYAQTGHAIAPQFWSYWSSRGLEFDGKRGKSEAESLALFGYPVSEAAVETNANGDRVLTQWFERARFEYHPGNPAAYQVLLGLLGNELVGNGR